MATTEGQEAALGHRLQYTTTHVYTCLLLVSIREKSPNVQDYGEDRWKLLPALGSDYMSRRMIWPLVMVVAIRAAT